MGRKIIGVTVGTPTKPKRILDKMQLDWVATKEKIGGNTVIIPEQKVTGGIWSKLQLLINLGITYDIHINGEIYPCIAYEYDGVIVLGNYTIADKNANVPHNNEPFYIVWAGGSATAGMFEKNNTLSYPITLKVTDHAETVCNKMPEDYLPGCVVKSVNGQTPDESGNVNVPTGGGGSGLNNEAASLLVDILRHATYDEDVSSQIERLEEILLGDSGGDTGGDNTGGDTGDDGGDTDSGLIITDDGNGNVSITTFGNATITDDGNGNVTITVPDGVSITDDGNGNVVIA